MQTARSDSMQLMDQHIQELLKAKHISGEEACRCALDKKAFEPYLSKIAAEAFSLRCATVVCRAAIKG